MSDFTVLKGVIEPELLVATCCSDGSILFRNDAWLRILGNETDLWSRLVDGDRETAQQNFKEACGGSLVTHALFMADRINRDLPAPVLLHFIPVSDSPSSAGVGTTSVTITGEVLSEPDSWTENQTDRHRMETLGRMTMGITHDFNNLLGGVLGHIDIMRSEGILDSASSGIKEHLGTIEKAAQGGAALISKIQRYIRQEKKVAFEPVNLASLVSDCVALTKPYWFNEPRRQGIDIKLSCECEDGLSVSGSPSELRDVLVNLLLNAVQAMPRGGEINLEARTEDKNAIIRVCDTGTGMTEEIRARIFEPLFTTKTGRGSGMGLSVALGIIQEHEGGISVSSESQVGTAFEITLPLLEHASGESKDLSPHDNNAPASILVVDDEEMVRNVISRLLTLHGHQVTATASAGEAIETLSGASFDIIFSDQGMPTMNGREFAKVVEDRFGNIPFVLLTGDTDVSIDPGSIHRVIAKPFKIEELESAIHDLV